MQLHQHFCAGNIISEYSVLLPAHCFFTGPADSQRYSSFNQIRAGAAGNDFDNQFVKTYELSSVVKHPGYRGRGPKNDLAIAFTKTKIDFNARIGKISIPETKIDVTNPTEALFSAWMYKDDAQVEIVFKTGYMKMFSKNYCLPKFFRGPEPEIFSKVMPGLCAGTPVSLIVKIVFFQKILNYFLRIWQLSEEVLEVL